MEANADFANFKEMVKKYLTINNEVLEVQMEIKQKKAEIEELITAQKQEIEELKHTIAEKNEQKATLEPYLMKFMKQYEYYDIKTSLGRLKYSESTAKKRLTKEVIKERVEKIFENHEKRNEIIQMIFNSDEREKREGLKYQPQVDE